MVSEPTRQQILRAIKGSIEGDAQRQMIQESDWKCYLAYALRESLGDGYGIHTEVRIPTYGVREKCDVVVINRLDDARHFDKRPTITVKYVAAIELKMHASQKQKALPRNFKDRLTSFLADVARLTKSPVRIKVAAFMDISSYKDNGEKDERLTYVNDKLKGFKEKFAYLKYHQMPLD